MSAHRPRLVPSLIVIAVVLLIGVIGLALARSGLEPVNSGPAPDFALTTFDGQPYRLSDQRGKVVLINFWASWCGPCRGEAPILNKLYDQYRDRVSFIGVGYLDNRGDALKFMGDFAMRYPTAPDDGTHASGAYRVHQVPETYLIDKRGLIAYHLPAPITSENADTLRALLDQLVGS